MANKEIIEALQEYFSPNGENKRFFDATQIPRICNDINNIQEYIKEIKETLKDGSNKYASKLTEKIVYGGISFVLLAVLSAIVYLVIKK